MTDLGSIAGAVRGVGSVVKGVRRCRERKLRKIVRAAQRSRGFVVLNKLERRWVLQVGDENFPAEQLDELKRRGLVEPVTLTPTQAVAMDYCRLTALGEKFAE